MQSYDGLYDEKTQIVLFVFERPLALNSSVVVPLQAAGNFKFLKDNEALPGQVASAGSSRLRSHMHKGPSEPSVRIPSPFAGSVSS